MNLIILKMDVITILVNVPGRKRLHMVPVLHMLKGLATMSKGVIGIAVLGILGFVGVLDLK